MSTQFKGGSARPDGAIWVSSKKEMRKSEKRKIREAKLYS